MAAIAGLARRFPSVAREEFRWYWVGMLCYSFGMQSREVVTGWLIYSLTGSALSLGYYIGTWGLAAFVFSFIGGTFSDRLGPRRVVIAFRMLAGFSLLVICLLLATGRLAMWHMLVFNFLNGMTSAFEYPARSALVPRIIPKEELTSSFGLSYMAMNLAAVLGPAPMGFVTEHLGATWALLIMGVIMLISAVLIVPIRSGDRPEDADTVRGTVLGDSLKGLRYVLGSPWLLALEASLLVYVVLLMPYRDMMPAVAADVLGVGASGLGLLSSGMSIGALVGTFVVSAMKEIRSRGLVLLGAALVQGIGIMVFARSRVFLLSLFLLSLAGVGRGFYITLDNALLQAYALPAMRARVVGINMVVWSFQPFGSILVGALADRLGPGPAIFWSAAVGSMLLLLNGVFSPYMRKLE